MMSEECQFTCYTDGASRGNPGLCAYSYIIVDPSGSMVSRNSDIIGEGTNNTAEYCAVIEGLVALSAMTSGQVCVCSDSELVIRQLNGIYRINAKHLRILHGKVQRLIGRFESVKFFNVPRYNPFIREADFLCNKALDGNEQRAPGTE